jgi:ATP-binding cassette subfamily B protein
MVAKYYGRQYNTIGIRQDAGFSKIGVSMSGLSEAAEKLGFRTRGVQLTYNALTSVKLPCILHWTQKHYVVVYKFKRSGNNVMIADPARGLINYTRQEFLQKWVSSKFETGEEAGIALLLEPTAGFYENEGEKENKISWGIIFQYLKRRQWQLAQVFIALFITTLFQLIFPFLTQSIVDAGINARNMQYVTVVLIAQIMLVFSQTIVEFIRSRLLLRISVYINLSILSDFWIKITRLPLSYFDSHRTGDTLQRINDNKQIQAFLTGTALNTLFSLINFGVFAIVLALYDWKLFFIFTLGTVLYFLWVKLFLRVRRKVNYLNFHISSKENSATLQLIQGMQEIRLNNAEQSKRWEWENIQANLYKLSFKNLSIGQVQQSGALLINQGKNLAITFIVAQLVINGQLTLGAMLAIQYILGQLNGPIEQFVTFAQSSQDAKISMERLNEIHSMPNEEETGVQSFNGQVADPYINYLPTDKTISLRNFTFSYPGTGNNPVLKNINLEIPEGKITAIVGVSGSGKTTLLKLLLRYYNDYNGEILIGNTNYKHISPSFLRSQCGAVLQDGYIFNDSIMNNIVINTDKFDHDKLLQCCKTANILSFIESLPNGFHTQLGAEGAGISQGQKQRLLIARAIYRDPAYLFFDEATNALDANNEKAIVENLQEFLKGRTVVIVAHRLSTVKNADKIVVLQQGNIIEEGTHLQLSDKKGSYYQLVKNQLELGN